MTVVLATVLAVVLAGAVAAVAAAMIGRRMAAERTAADRPAAEAMDKLREKLDQLSARVDSRLEQVAGHMRDGLGRSDKTMTDIHQRLAVIDDAQKRLTDLSTRVVGLQDILSNKQARGAFGEWQLETIVRDLLPSTVYAFRRKLSTGAIPDCLILLPTPPGPVAVDAKFPRESYEALRTAGDEAARVAASRAFTRDMTTHINDIADKYILPGETSEGAVLFLPSEAVFAELHSNFANVVEHSHRRRVSICSPSTLVGLLRNIGALLRDVRIREEVGRIRDELMRLLDDVHRLDQRVSSLDQHFRLAEKDIRDIRTSAGKITQRGERMGEVDLAGDDGAAGHVEDARQPELPTMRVVKD